MGSVRSEPEKADPMWEWDASCVPELWFNGALVRLLGFAAIEWSRARFEALCEPSEYARVLEQVRALQGSSSETFTATLSVQDSRGELRPLSTCGVTVRDSAGVVQRALGFVRELPVEGAGFRGKIAHDFNNLLAIISTSLSIADLQLERERHAQARVTLAAASSAVERAAALLRAARGVLRSRVDLNAVVSAIGERAPGLTARLAPGLPVILGDDLGMQQVVKRLVTQVADAVGQVTVATGVERGEIVLQVEGAGGASSSVPPLDELSVEMLKAHRAGFEQHGAQFTLRFPLPGGSSFHVLMVDDEQMVRRGAARLLAHFGCTVEEAENGRHALEVVNAAQRPFELVLMDVTMPVLDGVAAAREMRARWPTMTVVLSSGLSDPECELPEGVRFLPKPWDRGAIESLLRELRAH